MTELCSDCLVKLGVKSRVKIYNFLKLRGKRTVTEITEFLKLRQPTVSYHLDLMEKAGFLSKDQDGKYFYYYINTQCSKRHSKCFLSK